MAYLLNADGYCFGFLIKRLFWRLPNGYDWGQEPISVHENKMGFEAKALSWKFCEQIDKFMSS